MDIIKANWSASEKVKAFTTTKLGGVSSGHYSNLNLSTNVGDEIDKVEINRKKVIENLSIPNDIVWLNQCHSIKVLELPLIDQQLELYQDDCPFLSSDAAYTDKPNTVCTVLTADCLPIVITNTEGNEVAAVHAGWKGLCDGILEETIKKFKSPSGKLLVWIGPSILKDSFQIGPEVIGQFVDKDQTTAEFFYADESQENKWFGDLPAIAKNKLLNVGLSLNNIFLSNIDTYTDSRFFSFRREEKTGRMATFIWFS